MMASYFGEYVQFFGRIMIWAWSISIMCATVLIHEHYVVDVFGGIVLAWLSLRWFYFNTGSLGARTSGDP